MRLSIVVSCSSFVSDNRTPPLPGCSIACVKQVCVPWFTTLYSLCVCLSGSCIVKVRHGGDGWRSVAGFLCLVLVPSTRDLKAPSQAFHDTQHRSITHVGLPVSPASSCTSSSTSPSTSSPVSPSTSSSISPVSPYLPCLTLPTLSHPTYPVSPSTSDAIPDPCRPYGVTRTSHDICHSRAPSVAFPCLPATHNLHILIVWHLSMKITSHW